MLKGNGHTFGSLDLSQFILIFCSQEMHINVLVYQLNFNYHLIDFHLDIMSGISKLQCSGYQFCHLEIYWIELYLVTGIFSFIFLLYTLCVYVDIFLWIFFIVAMLYHYNSIFFHGVSKFASQESFCMTILQFEHEKGILLY